MSSCYFWTPLLVIDSPCIVTHLDLADVSRSRACPDVNAQGRGKGRPGPYGGEVPSQHRVAALRERLLKSLLALIRPTSAGRARGLRLPHLVKYSTGGQPLPSLGLLVGLLVALQPKCFTEAANQWQPTRGQSLSFVWLQTSRARTICLLSVSHTTAMEVCRECGGSTVTPSPPEGSGGVQGSPTKTTTRCIQRCATLLRTSLRRPSTPLNRHRRSSTLSPIQLESSRVVRGPSLVEPQVNTLDALNRHFRRFGQAKPLPPCCRRCFLCTLGAGASADRLGDVLAPFQVLKMTTNVAEAVL